MIVINSGSQLRCQQFQVLIKCLKGLWGNAVCQEVKGLVDCRIVTGEGVELSHQKGNL